MVNLKSLRGENVDTYVADKSHIEKVVNIDYGQRETAAQSIEDVSMEKPPKPQRPAYLRRLAKNIVPSYQEAVLNQSRPFNDTMHSRF